MSEDPWVWGDDDNQDSELVREWQSRRDEFWNSGYREGIEAGKAETVQDGFDAGYAAGAAAGYEWGVLRGAVLTAQAASSKGVLAADVSEAGAALADLAPGTVCESVCSGLMHQDDGSTGDAAGVDADLLVRQASAVDIVPAAERRAVAALEQLGLAVTRVHTGSTKQDVDRQRGAD